MHVQLSHDMELDPDIVPLESPEVASISAEPVENEASSHSTEEGNVSDGRNKRQNVTPLSWGRDRRMRIETSHVANAVSEMASVTNKRATLLAHRSDQFSISSCIKVLNEMLGIDQDFYLAALDLFQDPDRRETFISIKSDMRLAWLKAKCNSL